MPATSHLLMIRPVDFKFNKQTAANNMFQEKSTHTKVQEFALQEFDGYVVMLRKNGVNVLVIEDTLKPESPDSIFPNNWISMHKDGEVILYPMFSPNRRVERRADVVDMLKEKFYVKKVTDLSFYEHENLFLEGTGSLVLDRKHKIAYACLSVRTSEKVIEDFCAETNYKAITFHGTDQDHAPIYHSNVMMCVADDFAVICTAAIADKQEREKITESLITTGKEIIEITFGQMNQFAGNVLQIKNKADEKLIVMSEQAFKTLNQEQIDKLEKFGRIIYAPLYTIEKNGGGSARCMLAEIFLPDKI
ncbi:hypothetical protein ABIB40_003393 [Pedobacter sp. UYP30]|uniref:citrulline utilization hydrolase CtlX n=1 Tax=Pedobacter sp. UYP30 TaxID=1756400 RepID=UPI003393D247